MKKAILYISFLLCMANCGQTNESEKESAVDTLANIKNNTPLEDKVSMTISSENFQYSDLGKTAEIMIANNTNEKILTGDHYYIEHFKDGQWQKLSFFEEIAFHDIGYQLAPLESKKFNISFYGDKHTYDKGQYRVVKYYLKEDYQHTKRLNDIYAPFTIE